MPGTNADEPGRHPPTAPVFRFAPSPNGYLHLGHAYSALLNGRMAEGAGGRLLLRLEDIDRQRCREEFASAIEEDLAWLGLRWEGEALRQSSRFAAYSAALDALIAAELAYPCFCTRSAIAASVAGRHGWPADPDGVPLYPGTCRGLGQAERARRLAGGWPAALRLDMGRALARCGDRLAWCEYGEARRSHSVEAEAAVWGDALVARKDVPASYHLAVVVDDAHQGITDVVRGKDLFHATSLHRLLQALLGLPAPRYHHHRLILDASGRKLSKSLQAPSLRALRREGAIPADIEAAVGLR